MTSFYSCFRQLMRVTLQLFFKQIRVEGMENIPTHTPILVTANHQNAFLDALIAGAFFPKGLYYLTRSDVFNKWSEPLLSKLNMMPIYRMRDGFSNLSKNETIFDTCISLFKEKKSILIFAEGNHGEAHYLRPITKGAARIALQAQEELGDDNLYILPLGINYFDHKHPKSIVIVSFGTAIPMKEHAGFNEKHPTERLKLVRNAISEHMKKALVIPENSDDYEVKKRAVFNSENAEHSLTELQKIAIKPALQKQSKRKKHYLAKVLNPLPFLVIYFVLNRVADVVFHASMKFALGLFLFPVWWGAVFVLVSLIVGIKMALLSICVMIMGLFYSYRNG